MAASWIAPSACRRPSAASARSCRAAPTAPCPRRRRPTPARSTPLASPIRGERERVAARERSLEAEAERAAEAERWRRWGEAIYAHAWTLQPGQRELVADGLTVPLDPARTPSENARDYFERYRKAQSAAANLPDLLAATRTTLAYLDQLLTLLDLAGRYDEIAALDRERQQWQTGERTHGDQGAQGAKANQDRKG